MSRLSFKKMRILGAAMGSIGLIALGAPSAMATPTVTIDNVSMPVGYAIGGYAFSAQTLVENLITGTGQTNTAIGAVNGININGLVNSNTYTYGQGGVYLNFYATGFTSTCVGTTACPNQVDFSGGTITLYADSAPVTTSGNLANIVSAMQSGSTFLQLTAESIDNSTTPATTIIATLATGTPLTFSNAFSAGFFAATGGDAMNSLDPMGFINPASLGPLGTSPTGYAAVNFNSSDHVACTPTGNALSAFVPGSICGTTQQAYVSGTGNVTFNAVPEPSTLALMGSGLIGLLLVRRRRSRKSA